jgi:hypothetical protein
MRTVEFHGVGQIHFHVGAEANHKDGIKPLCSVRKDGALSRRPSFRRSICDRNFEVPMRRERGQIWPSDY